MKYTLEYDRKMRYKILCVHDFSVEYQTLNDRSAAWPTDIVRFSTRVLELNYSIKEIVE